MKPPLQAKESRKDASRSKLNTQAIKLITICNQSREHSHYPMPWTSPATKEAILLAKASGTHVSTICRTFKVSPATVYRITRSVKQKNDLARQYLVSPQTDLSQLKEKMLHKSHVAIDRSLDDTQEPHKAASTGLAYLRGVGEHGGERKAEVNVQVLIANVPPGFDALMSRHGLGEVEVIESKDVTGVDDDGSP